MTKDTSPDLLKIGRITAAHSLNGLVRIKALTEKPMDLLTYGAPLFRDGTPAPDMEIHGEHKGQLLVKIDGVSDRTTAESWAGRELFLPADALPAPEDEDEFYARDLIGLTAQTADGTVLGRITAVPDFGAGDLLEVIGESKVSQFYAFTKAVVPHVDLAARIVTVCPPDEVISQDEQGNVH